MTEEDITTACERMYTSRYLLGCFADDCEYDKIPYTANDTDENDALALEAAEKCMVLLRNDGVLPLDAGKSARLPLSARTRTACPPWRATTTAVPAAM